MKILTYDNGRSFNRYCNFRSEFPFLKNDDICLNKFRPLIRAKFLNLYVCDSNNRILIVDDDFVHRQFLRCVFEDFNIDVHEASNGVIGKKMFFKNSYDILFTDICMPKMNGLQLIEAIFSKNSAENQGIKNVDIPIIVCSSETNRIIIEKCMNRGAKYFLKKPVDVNYVYEILKKVNLQF